MSTHAQNDFLLAVKTWAEARTVALGVEQCDDPTHSHRDPVQVMGAFEVKGHFIQVTQDGDRYNLRIDRDATYYGLTAAELNQHIEEL